MTSKPEGGPAFPLAQAANGGPYNAGMTMRKYIAIEAMTALIANEGAMGEGFEINHVRTAYRYADVMLAEDEK